MDRMVVSRSDAGECTRKLKIYRQSPHGFLHWVKLNSSMKIPIIYTLLSSNMHRENT